MDLLLEWAGTILGLVATTLFGILVARMIRAAGTVVDFIETERARGDHVSEVVDQLLEIHVTPSTASLFQNGRVIEVLLASNKQQSRLEALLTAIFELVLLLSGGLETSDSQRAVKAIERELRGALLSD